AAAVLILSEKEKADLMAFGISAARVLRLPNPIDPADYSALPPRGCFRKRWRIQAGKIVLFLGRLSRIKGIDVLVAAFTSVRRDMNDDVQLVLAGPDEGEGARIHGGEGILKTGFLNHEAKLAALVDSDVVVLPS